MGIQLLAGTCIVKNKKVLLIQQKPDGDQPNKWGPPAGHGNAGETPIQVAVRETKEETNLEIDTKGMVQCGLLRQKNKEYLIVLYLATPKNTGQFKINPDEVQNYHWTSLSELKSNKFPLRKNFLKEPLIRALTQKTAPVDTFVTLELEQD